MRSSCICLIGVDGVGKTTQLVELMNHLQSMGNKCVYVHIRRPYLISLPLLAYCRLIGLTKYGFINGFRYGSWEFHQSKFVSTVLPLTLLIDTALATFTAIHLRLLLGYTVICDRCVYDTMIDLMMGIDNEELFNEPLGHLFLSLLPKESRIFLLINEDIESLRKRRKDLLGDNTLQKRQKLYQKIAAHAGIPEISTSQPVTCTQMVIQRLVGDLR